MVVEKRKGLSPLGCHARKERSLVDEQHFILQIVKLGFPLPYAEIYSLTVS